jgi:TP901 family phage tail tape measure protein
LAAANNDISESIALITTANTIAQDPTTVGQGIKTVSLRLRSTKTQIEEMGEDAEGAAENVSKLREQMLALTGVDIQFDDSTYKSTYQILLEISKVWDKLDDLSQASVLEQLFGKRQANIGAAILENGKLLEQVYRTSEGSMGSAMREQQEYAKSIQYSIDTLKAAYQDFADSVVNSDFVKNLLGTAQSFLEVLTKIIDKFGTLPTILTSIAAIGGLKGVGKLIPNMPKLALLQSKAQVDTPHQRDFQLLEMPKAV